MAVLGAGPAGLLAAEAADELGYEVEIYSNPNERGETAKSSLHGCQYLHQPVPASVWPMGGDHDARNVAYTLRGESDAYRRKVYGDAWNGVVSPDEFGPEKPHLAWDLRYMYDRLWDKWGGEVTRMHLGPSTFYGVYANRNYSHIISSIPAPALCLAPQEHKFNSTDIWAIGETTDGNQKSPVHVPPFTVVCNGEAGQGWYRAANVFGYTTVEWPGGKRPPIEGVVGVRKPLDTDCACWVSSRPSMLRVGRYGRWRKGVLVHEAYTDTKKFLGNTN